ncbi:hypothetical protein PIB30_112773, partial [Stylosanthes scabra]|nr:hypothetical protein [Stylosanthes scabra]
MASVQCYKTCQETCQQKNAQSSLTCQQNTHHQSSFGHKITDMFKGHHNNGATATQTHAKYAQCHSQCRGDNHHTACSYFHTHTHTQQAYGAANHHNNGAHHGVSHQNGCSKSHIHTQSCGGATANHHHNNGAHHGGSQYQYGCSKSHTHTQSCGGATANHHLNNGGSHHNGGGYGGMTTKTSETDYFHSETKTTTANRCNNGTSKKEHKSG